MRQEQPGGDGLTAIGVAGQWSRYCEDDWLVAGQVKTYLQHQLAARYPGHKAPFRGRDENV